MGNMAYCRFRNTIDDLRDCHDYIFDECDDKEEESARKKLIKLCKEIVEDVNVEEAP